MSILVCPDCRRLMNTHGECPDCGTPTMLNEASGPIGFRTEAERERTAEREKHRAELEAYEARKRFAPLSRESVKWIDRSLSGALDWCNESSEGKSIREHLEKAMAIVGEIRARQRRSV